MKRVTYGILSSLLILSVTLPVGAKTPTATIAQSPNSATIEQMYREQKVLSDEIQTLMAEMKAMMAEMKALTSVPEGKTPTMADLYKQQQVILSRLETLSQSRLDTILPKRSAANGTATAQDVYQQQQAMMTEMKSMMADMKKMLEVYRGRAGVYKQ
jgi:cytochrome c556